MKKLMRIFIVIFSIFPLLAMQREGGVGRGRAQSLPEEKVKDSPTICRIKKVAFLSEEEGENKILSEKRLSVEKIQEKLALQKDKVQKEENNDQMEQKIKPKQVKSAIIRTVSNKI